MSGNFQLCKALVKEGVCLGTSNKQGVNIFNCQVASRNLLNKLLDYLPQEPIWSESDTCLECGLKFSLTVRKHHCRCVCRVDHLPILLILSISLVVHLAVSSC